MFQAKLPTNTKPTNNLDKSLINPKKTNTNPFEKILKKIDEYVLSSPNQGEKIQKAKTAIEYMLTGQTLDTELKNFIIPLKDNTRGKISSFFSSSQKLSQLEFFQLVYLTNFIAPVKIFNNGQLDITEVKKLIHNEVCSFQIERFPDEYKQDIKINKSQIEFIIKSSGIFGANQTSYIHNINNDIVNIKPYKLQNPTSIDDNGQKRDYRHIPGKINTLGYISKKGDKKIDLNGAAKIAKNEDIACRHLAFAYLKINNEDYDKLSRATGIGSKAEEGKRYHGIFSTLTGITSIPDLKYNIFDEHEILYKADEYWGVSLNNFGNCLAKICGTMEPGKTKYMLFMSENHVMSVIIKHKPEKNRYTIKFYDPNQTNVHQNLLTQSIADIERLSLINHPTKVFLSQKDVDKYFPNIKAGVFLVYHDPNKDRSDMVIKDNYINIEFTELNKFLYYSFYLNNLKGVIYISKKILADLCLDKSSQSVETVATKEKQAIELLQARNYRNTGLYEAFEKGFTDVVKQFANIIVDSKLSSDAKTKILLAISKPGYTGLCTAFAKYHLTTIKKFTKIILKTTHLSSEQKLKILCAKSCGVPALQFAFTSRDKQAIQQFTQDILTSSLSDEHKFELLLAKNDAGNSGLYIAYLKENTGAITAFEEMLNESDTLSADDKLELLLAKGTQGYAALIYPFKIKNQDASRLNELIHMIDSSKSLSADDKLELKLTHGVNFRSKLHDAFAGNDIAIIKNDTHTILNSSLSLQRKLEILLAVDKDGNSGLYIADLNGNKEAIAAFKEALNKSNTLSTDDKLEFRLEQGFNIRAQLHEAFVKNNGENIKKYAQLILQSKLSTQRKLKILRAVDKDGNSGLYTAYLKEDTGVITAFEETLNNSNTLNADDKLELLLAKGTQGYAALIYAFKIRVQDASRLNELISMINNSKSLNTDDKLELKLTHGVNFRSKLHNAFANNDIAIIKNDTHTILNSSLSLQRKLKILRAMDKDDNSGLYTAYLKKNTGAITAFEETLNKSNTLSADDKLELLLAKGTQGYAAFVYAFKIRVQDASRLNKLIHMINNSKSLSADDKREITLANGHNLRFSLYNAFEKNNVNAIKKYTQLILQSKLSTQRKFEILRAMDKDGNSGLYIASLNGHKDAITTFEEMLSSSNQLSTDDKLNLLKYSRHE